MAADVAAMAPNTSIGAAHPVSIGAGGDVEKTDDVMKKKMENDAASSSNPSPRSAHRNVEWARSAVIDSASITAEKALELNVIDLIAERPAGSAQASSTDARSAARRFDTAGARVDRNPHDRAREIPAALPAARGDVRPDARRDLRDHRRIEQSRARFCRAWSARLRWSSFSTCPPILPVNVAGLALIGLAVVLFIVDILRADAWRV